MGLGVNGTRHRLLTKLARLTKEGVVCGPAPESEWPEPQSRAVVWVIPSKRTHPRRIDIWERVSIGDKYVLIRVNEGSVWFRNYLGDLEILPIGKNSSSTWSANVLLHQILRGEELRKEFLQREDKAKEIYRLRCEAEHLRRQKEVEEKNEKERRTRELENQFRKLLSDRGIHSGNVSFTINSIGETPRVQLILSKAYTFNGAGMALDKMIESGLIDGKKVSQ